MAGTDRLIEAFNHALGLASEEDRAGFLAGLRSEEPALAEQVVSLLEANRGAGNFLKTGSLIAYPTTPSEKPGDRIGRFKLLQKIGEGGCGVVYMAEQDAPVRRRVALKIIKLGMDTKEVIARFEAERQALAMMDHPNIAKVFEAGATETGRPYFVMELVRGLAITNFCDLNEVPTEERLRLFIQVCQAVQHAHQKGVIHRDLKPSNILITTVDGESRPMVIDFGIAKATQGRLTDATLFTAFEQFIGTPAYMSPEQAVLTTVDVDTRSDIYSLGVLLYELLTGRTPFEQSELLARGLDEMRRAIREEEPPRPSARLSTMAAEALTTTAKCRQTEANKLIGSLRGDLDWIVMKCLEKERARRYETASGLAEDVKRHLEKLPVQARPASRAYRFRRFVRRNRFAVSAGAIIAATIGVGFAMTTWLYGLETRARRRAATAEQEQSRERSRTASEAARANRESAAARESARELRELSYAAQIRAAQVTIEARRYEAAVELLQQHVPKHDEEDFRGLEWRYLWSRLFGDWETNVTRARTDGTGRIPPAPSSPQNPDWSISSNDVIGGFSRDNATLVIWDETGLLQWRQASDGKLIRSAQLPVPPEEARSVHEVGDRIILGTKSGLLQEWDPARAQVIHSVPLGDGPVTVLKVSPDKKRAALLRHEGPRLRIWNLETWREEDSITVTGDDKDLAGMVAFSDSGEMLAVAVSDHLVKYGDAAREGPSYRIDTKDASVTAVAISPIKASLVYAAKSGELRITSLPRVKREEPKAFHFDLPSPKMPTFGGHGGRIAGVRFTPDGRTLLTEGTDGCRFWNVTTGQEMLSFPKTSVSISPDGNVLVWRITRDGADHVSTVRLPTLSEIDSLNWQLPPPAQPPAIKGVIRG